jgi:Fe-S oxidoreductase
MPIQDVLSTVENCRYCLMCRHVASVEYVTHKETLSPHGWALVIASVKRGLLEWNADTVDVLYSAPDNGNSRAHCVTNQPLPEAIAAARAEVARLNLAPPIVYEVGAALKEWGTPFARRKPGIVNGEGDVALFVGDEVQYLWPNCLKATLEILQKLSINPVLIGVGRNNGYLASSLGLPELAAELGQATLAELKATGARLMLVLSPGDYFTFHQLYPERLGIDWPEAVELLELTTFLADQLEGGEIRFKRSDVAAAYAYIDPTHAVRVPGRHGDPRKLLASVLSGESRELFWRRERAHPVGSTALQFTRPDIAAKLTLARLEDARRSGAELLVTDDAGTLSKLSERAAAFDLRVAGLYELLADNLI